MADTRQLRFGYNPPTGDRGIEKLNPATFTQDLQRVLDRVAPYFSSFWVSDHLMTNNGFRMECWTQLTWLAARYPDQILSTIVMANSYRHPPLLGKMAATLQAFSGGRFILGYGAGWAEEEYGAYGYDYPSAKIRIAQMVEGIEVMRALWTGGPVSYEGQYYQLRDAICDPKPDPPIPVLIGGDGERFLLRAVAQHADWWLPFSRNNAILTQKMAVLRDHCTAVGRDYATIRKSFQLHVHLAPTRAEAEQRAGNAPSADSPTYIGDPAGLRERLQELHELGIDMVQLVFRQFPDTGDIELFGQEVLPYFR